MQRREKVALTTVTGQRSTLSIKYQRQVQTGSIHAFAKIGPVLWGKLPKYTRIPHLLLPSFKSCIKKLLNPISSLKHLDSEMRTFNIVHYHGYQHQISAEHLANSTAKTKRI